MSDDRPLRDYNEDALVSTLWSVKQMVGQAADLMQNHKRFGTPAPARQSAWRVADRLLAEAEELLSAVRSELSQ